MLTDYAVIFQKKLTTIIDELRVENGDLLAQMNDYWRRNAQTESTIDDLKKELLRSEESKRQTNEQLDIIRNSLRTVETAKRAKEIEFANEVDALHERLADASRRIARFGGGKRVKREMMAEKEHEEKATTNNKQLHDDDIDTNIEQHHSHIESDEYTITIIVPNSKSAEVNDETNNCDESSTNYLNDSKQTDDDNITLLSKNQTKNETDEHQKIEDYSSNEQIVSVQHNSTTRRLPTIITNGVPGITIDEAPSTDITKSDESNMIENNDESINNAAIVNDSDKQLMNKENRTFM